MGMRFRKSVKILPGVRLNFSGSGVSATVGPRGARVTLGRRGTHGNVGSPGTGFSWRERMDRRGREARSVARPPRAARVLGVVLPFVGFYLLFYAAASLVVSAEGMPLVALLSLAGAGAVTWWRRRTYLKAHRGRDELA